MAHIPDGVLSLPVVAGGWAVAAGMVGVSLRRLTEAAIPGTAVLSAAFFTVSLVAVPDGPSSVHLLLSGLMGLMIGPLTAPAVMIGLALQALLFGFGGLTTLGVNTVNIALPGILAGLVLAPLVRRAGPVRAGVLAGIGAGLAVLATG
ncbi:MAG: cobalt transporter CbiM, partial [Zavarzinia sp.]|nr:cobalt transporter CbiM [Zavarzinia sp.]